ncbi:MAG: PstS family phosphate ABC transporter substrate-binding protein [Magnetococcales bacterium]|nr:PstS family phosphate ABC transporter substrate-binding protein [Magnetococcales bacterium]MBF0114263.1 PstS family phosphate ABC transporter substrate-binding protein [Magnetococcales bacterium]
MFARNTTARQPFCPPNTNSGLPPMKRFALFLLLAASIPCAVLAKPARADTIISNKGSSTLHHLAQAWASAYHQAHPEVTIDVRSCGSNTGISALINNSVDLANSSRPLRPKEIAEAKRNGVQPVQHLVAYDALTIHVHPANPLKWISTPFLAEIYGERGTVNSWGQLGVMVPGCLNSRMHLVGRQSSSGTHDYFMDAVLAGKQDFKHGLDSVDVADPEEVIDLVAKNPCSIGYVGLGHESVRTKVLDVSHGNGVEIVTASMENAASNRYPLSRPLFIYTNGQPRGEVEQYLNWILSTEGQCIVQKLGYAPIRALPCREESKP